MSIENAPLNVPVYAVVRQRFQDQIAADGFAEAFLRQQFSRYEPSILEVRWYNIEGDDGRVGGLFVGGKIAVSVTVTRDAMNWAEVCGVAFV